MREERDSYKVQLSRYQNELARVQLSGWEQAALARLREFRATHAGGPDEDVRVVVVRKADYENKIKLIRTLQQDLRISRCVMLLCACVLCGVATSDVRTCGGRITGHVNQ